MSNNFYIPSAGPWITTCDPYFANVTQLCHFNGANGGTSLIQEAVGKGNTMTCNNNTVTSTTASKWGPSSLRVPKSGANQNYANAVSHADYNFGTGDWTVEFWVNPDNLTREFNSAKDYFDMRNDSLTSAWLVTIAADDDSGGMRYIANGSIRINGSSSMTAAAWNHIAIARASNTTRLFVNGSKVGSDFSDSNTYVQGRLRIGAAGNAGAEAVGYYQDLRVTKGVGRYTANFTIPAMMFPNV